MVDIGRLSKQMSCGNVHWLTPTWKFCSIQKKKNYILHPPTSLLLKLICVTRLFERSVRLKQHTRIARLVFANKFVGSQRVGLGHVVFRNYLSISQKMPVHGRTPSTWKPFDLKLINPTVKNTVSVSNLGGFWGLNLVSMHFGGNANRYFGLFHIHCRNYFKQSPKALSTINLQGNSFIMITIWRFDLVNAKT